MSDMQVVASIFGVGAPEAALVGVVALVVFGPQGLIDVRLHMSCSAYVKLPTFTYSFPSLIWRVCRRLQKQQPVP